VAPLKAETPQIYVMPLGNLWTWKDDGELWLNEAFAGWAAFKPTRRNKPLFPICRDYPSPLHEWLLLSLCRIREARREKYGICWSFHRRALNFPI